MDVVGNMLGKGRKRVYKFSEGDKIKGSLPGEGPITAFVEDIEDNSYLLRFYLKGQDREDYYSTDLIDRYFRRV